MDVEPVGTLDELQALADELVPALGAVLDRSTIHMHPALANPSPGFVYVPKDAYLWGAFPAEYQPLIGAARRLLTVWSELSHKAVATAAPNRLDDFRKAGQVMHEVIDQAGEGGAPASSVEGVRAKVTEACERQLQMLRELPSAHGRGELLVVPDTNALIYQPEVESWELPDGSVLVFVSQVVRELDAKKMDRNDGVSAAAETMTKRLKEYGRRGDNIDGVTLRPGVRVRQLPVDADMSATVSWLRAGHADDELLASTLELKMQDLTARIALVTGDTNLQNKARLARVTFADVEQLAEPRPQRGKRARRLDPEAEVKARARLQPGLPYAKSQLYVPPATKTTNPSRLSWVVVATPVEVPQGFANNVLAGPGWFEERIKQLYEEHEPGLRLPPGLRMEPSTEAGQSGFAVRLDFNVPSEGDLRFVADAGGVVGARYFRNIGGGGRNFVLRSVEEETLRPLATACLDALEMLGAKGRVLLEAWAFGISNSAVHTSGHPTLAGQQPGWLQEGWMHVSGETTLPAEGAAVEAVIADWGLQFARKAGIHAWQTA